MHNQLCARDAFDVLNILRRLIDKASVCSEQNEYTASESVKISNSIHASKILFRMSLNVILLLFHSSRWKWKKCSALWDTVLQYCCSFPNQVEIYAYSNLHMQQGYYYVYYYNLF